MAVVNANCLAIYYDSVNSQTKAKVLGPYADIAAFEASSPANANRILVVNEDATSGENNIYIGYGSVGSSTFVDREEFLELVGAATSSTLDLTNSVEVVARDGEGGTLQESTQDWSLSADGLIQVSDDAGVNLLDLARNKYYVIVKFSIDKNGTTTDYYGQALLESVQLSGGVDEIATYSVSMTGVDALLKE
jgi:hypothetical protein